MTEIIHRNAITPHRVHALARLVDTLRSPRREIVLELLQPEFLSVEQEVAKEIIAVAKTCRLIQETEMDEYQLGEGINPNDIATVEGFRYVMQRLLLGYTNEYDENFRFNLVTAWFAAQDDCVLDAKLENLVTRYNSDLFADQDIRDLNDEKARPWQNWARFLGFGWISLHGEQTRFVPDAYGRILPLLANLLPEIAVLTECRVFLERLGDACPELDGGVLFNRAWAASHSERQRGNEISLMLATALRGLTARGYLTLIRQPDSSENWVLPIATGDSHNIITHLVFNGDRT